MTSLNGAPPASERDRGDAPNVDAKARRAWRIAGLGSVILGGGLAAVTAVSGGDGRVGSIAFIAGALLACLAGAVYAVYSAAIDSFRGREVGRARVIAAVGLGALSLLLPVCLLGVAAQAG